MSRRGFVILICARTRRARGIPQREDRDEHDRFGFEHDARPVPQAHAGQDATKPDAKPKSKSGRESIESFVVVFVAFLVWSLEAEGFVIPTGSMATTLMGRHKEIVCPECGDVYTVNADREVDSSGSGGSTGVRVVKGTCVNCRFETRGRSRTELFGRPGLRDEARAHPLPFLGSACAGALKRWDVTVFKLPEEPEVRYIKRLVGMPNEVVRIEGGDLWMRPVDVSRLSPATAANARSPAGDADDRL